MYSGINGNKTDLAFMHICCSRYMGYSVISVSNPYNFYYTYITLLKPVRSIINKGYKGSPDSSFPLWNVIIDNILLSCQFCFLNSGGFSKEWIDINALINFKYFFCPRIHLNLLLYCQKYIFV